jgi:hypothetical protein
MAGRTLDAIIMETLGLKEMTIARLLWQVEDLKAQLAASEAERAAAKESQPT